MKACFIGHRKVENDDRVSSALKEVAETLIRLGFKKFLFGSKSKFDTLSWEVVTGLKKKYPFIQRIYVRAGNRYIDKSYEEYILRSYEETYCPPKLEKRGRFSYVERNCEMIDRSICCVFYYNENYTPFSECHGRESRKKSGTKIAYEYAVKKKKQEINVYSAETAGAAARL